MKWPGAQTFTFLFTITLLVIPLSVVLKHLPIPGRCLKLHFSIRELSTTRLVYMLKVWVFVTGE